MADLEDPDPGVDAVEVARTADVGAGFEPSVVGQSRDRSTHGGVHPVRQVEEVTAVRRQGVVVLDQPASADWSTGSGWVPWLTWGSC